MIRKGKTSLRELFYDCRKSFNVSPIYVKKLTKCCLRAVRLEKRWNFGIRLLKSAWVKSRSGLQKIADTYNTDPHLPRRVISSARFTDLQARQLTWVSPYPLSPSWYRVVHCGSSSHLCFATVTVPFQCLFGSVVYAPSGLRQSIPLWYAAFGPGIHAPHVFFRFILQTRPKRLERPRKLSLKYDSEHLLSILQLRVFLFSSKIYCPRRRGAWRIYAFKK